MNTVVSSNSSNIVALSVVSCISSSVSVFIKTDVGNDEDDDGFNVVVVAGNFSVVCTTVVVDCGFFVAGFVAIVSIEPGFVIGFLVTGTLLDEDTIGFRVGKRVVSVNRADDATTGLTNELCVVYNVLGDCVTLGIKIHSGGCSVFTRRKKTKRYKFIISIFILNINHVKPKKYSTGHSINGKNMGI